jgi:hypothetical protein
MKRSQHNHFHKQNGKAFFHLPKRQQQSHNGIENRDEKIEETYKIAAMDVSRSFQQQ